MKVKTLLDQCAKCKTDRDAQELLDNLTRIFGNARPVCHLGQYNAEAYMEDGSPFIRFELNKEISDHYVTMIRPEIRDGKFVVAVAMNLMTEANGMSSHSWTTVEGMDDLIEPSPESSLYVIAKHARDLAIANHAELIQRVGVPPTLAKQTAKKSW